MNGADLQKYLLELFARNEVELEPDEDDWLVTEGEFPAIRATWTARAGDTPGRLDVDIVLSEEQRIEEIFRGQGTGDAECRDALRRFEEHALPMLLAACWYVTDERKLRIEAWDIGIRSWDVFIGAPSIHDAEHSREVPAPVHEAVAAAIKNAGLTPQLHWLSVFHARDEDGAVRCEVTLDNEPWGHGTSALRDADWSSMPAGAHTVRWLMMLDVRDY
jgi:hypothetical protein